MDYFKMTLININTSYKKCMSASDLEKFMLTGKAEPGSEGQVMHLIDETPISMVAGAVDQLATKKNIDAESIWKNLARVAAEIKRHALDDAKANRTGWLALEAGQK